MSDPHAHPPLPPGTPAPSFRLPSGDAARRPPGTPVASEECRSLDELAGSPAVLVFYPADFTPVCGEELAIFSELLPELEGHGARVLGISADSTWCHRAFAEARSIRFPLLADFHPKGEVCRRYGCWREEDGLAERALFVLDREGKVYWSAVSAMDVNPGVGGVLDALERLEREQPAPGVAQPSRPAPGAEARP